jgi:hypothetical protein
VNLRLDIIEVFHLPTDAQQDIKMALTRLRHVVTLASSNNTLPDDGN